MVEVLERDRLIALMVAERDAERHGRGPIRSIRWPDDEDQLARTVELIAHDDSGELVVEHTRIESYPEQIVDHLALHRIFPKGGPELRGHANAGHFILEVNPGAMRSVPVDQYERVAATIGSWVAENLVRVPREGHDEPQLLRGEHPDVPFPWILWRWLPDRIGLLGPYARVVMVKVARSEDLEDLRARRLRRAVEAKLPKLLDAAGEHRRAILAIEDRDARLSAPLLVSRSLQTAAGAAPLPDVIYLVHTRGDPMLLVILEDRVWCHERNEFGWMRFSSERSAQLNSIPVTWL